MRDWNYDCNLADNEEIMLRYLLSPYYDYQGRKNYPIDNPKYEYSSYYNKYISAKSEQSFKWIAENIFNISENSFNAFKGKVANGTINNKEHLQFLKNNYLMQTDIYAGIGRALSEYDSIVLDNGNQFAYLYLPGEGTGVYDINVIQAEKKNNKYHIYYSWERDSMLDGYYSGKCYAVMDKKNIDGKEFWSLYSNCYDEFADGYEFGTGDDLAVIEEDYITDADRFLFSEPVVNTVRYLWNENNYANSCYVKEVDSDFAADWTEAMTNMLFRGLDGWRDIFSDATKVEKAEKILVGLLQCYQSEVKNLSEAKTAEKYASCYLNGLKLFMSVHALGNKSLNKITNKDIIQQLQKGEFDEIVAYMEKHKSIDTEAKYTLKEYHNSQYFAEGISKGLKFFNTGLTIAQLSLDTVNKLYELEALLTADEIYCEMLQYLATNCNYDVVQRAAQNLYNVIHGEFLDQILYVTVPLQNKLEAKLLDEALDKAAEATTFGIIIKKSYDFSVAAAELLFHNGSIQETKDCMRICAFTGRALGSWVIENQMSYLSSVGSGDSLQKAESARKFLYSLYMLAKTRSKGEESIQNMLKKVIYHFGK